jgi:acyl-CoA thioester hydrolase
VRHLYHCPMRWADLDLLGHVNNVVYVDYLQEARVDMFRVNAPDSRSEDLAEGVVVVRHEVSYRTPVLFSFEPVKIETWVTEIRAASFTMAYEIFDDSGAERVVHLRASTVLTPYIFNTERPRRLRPEERAALQPFLEPVDEDGPPASRRSATLPTEPVGAVTLYPVHVRFSDVDAYGHVNNVKYFEYFQEARIRLFVELGREVLGSGPAPIVVAHTDVDYRLPILVRHEPYACRSWISEVGRTSMILASEIRDGEAQLSRARTVAVWVDPESSRPTPLPAAVREAFSGLSQH